MTTTNSSGTKTAGVYLHVPFCASKCGYCDFLSFECGTFLVHKAYVKALVREIALLGKIYNNLFTVNSVYIGGGTPSILLPSMASDILSCVKDAFNTDIDAEITIEANPGTLTMPKLESYLNSGVNRISIGAQSFSGHMLKLLGRVHLASDIYNSFNMARDVGFNNINLDLMFGIPGQSMEMWKETLKRAFDLEPEHMSFYGLQIEEGTIFHEKVKKGVFEKISDELDREMYHFAVSELKNLGYHHYEISSAAKPGFECRHNLKYWSMENYIGAGLGSHSFVCGARTGNVRDFDKYVETVLGQPEGLLCIDALREWVHENSEDDDMAEYMFTGLRTMKGIDIRGFESRFGRRLVDVYAKEWPAVDNYVKNGLLIAEGGKLRLSEKGVDVSNRIMSEFMLIK